MRNFKLTVLADFLVAAARAQTDTYAYCQIYGLIGVQYTLVDRDATGLTDRVYNAFGLAAGQQVLMKHVDSCASGVVAFQTGPWTANLNGFFSYADNGPTSSI